jgi:hypothetical protein
MKNVLLLFMVSLLVSISGFSQKSRYTTSGAETILSFANIDDHGSNEGAIVRFAPVINVQTFYHSDFNTHVGIFIGLAVRNVGYIYDNYKTPTIPVVTYKKKFRSYNVGVPVGIKLGNLDGTFFYAGYEVELPVFYKEKNFDGGDKIDKSQDGLATGRSFFSTESLRGYSFPMDSI